MRVLKFLTLVLVFHAVCYAGQDKFTAGTFWVAFRDAVLMNNEKTLLSLTRLPLEVHGVSDSTPAKYYNRNELSPVLKKILTQPEYLPLRGKIVSKTG